MTTQTYDGCSVWSRDLAEPLAGTAARARGWLLVEEPGAWGPDGVTESALSPDVARDLEAAAEAAGVRVQLIRRPDRQRPESLTVFACHAAPGGSWTRRHRISDYDDLLDVDLAAIAEGSAGQGEVHRDPLFLVCTHAKRDACCAVFGREVAAALSATERGEIWETSHTGGHRFAPTLICLPDGLTYGRVEPRVARQAAQAYRRRELDLRWYRGRSWHDGWQQVADATVRREFGLAGLDDLDVGPAEGPGDLRTVRVATPTQRHEVTVERTLGEPRLIGCSKTEPSRPEVFRPRGITTR